jgi:hypothetical protein
MTLARFGNVVPVQMYVLLLIGYRLGRDHCRLDIPDEERLTHMRRGLEGLKQLTGEDYGYDVGAWHAFLSSRPEFGYTESYGFPGVREAVAEAVREAVDDPTRERLVIPYADRTGTSSSNN